MVYRLPTPEEVHTAISAVLTHQGTVGSQTAFHRMVTKRLKADHPDCRLGSVRLRHLAIHSGLIRLEIYTRTNRRPGPLEHCPVCGSQFDHVRNMTLDGGEVTLGHLCPVCQFATGKDWREPARYIFHAHPERVDQTTCPASIELAGGEGKR